MNFKNATMDTIRRYIDRVFRIEDGEINKIYWKEKKDDVHFGVVDVILRDRKVQIYAGDASQTSTCSGSGCSILNEAIFETESLVFPNVKESNNKYYIRERVPVLQSFIGHWFGFPWTPRKGDQVKVLFYQNEKAIVIGPIWNWEQKPVCRPDPYTVRWKWCQWRKPPQDEKTLDYGKRKEEGFYEHPPGKKPFCFNIYHGGQGDPPDTPEKGRDFQLMWDYCHLGDLDGNEHCQNCKTIDYTSRRDGDQWLKVNSKDTESVNIPPGRFEFKWGSGSFMRVEEFDAHSMEYTEGRGFIRLENAVSETDKRGHLQFSPDGTVDIHFTRNKGSGKVGCCPDSCSSLPIVAGSVPHNCDVNEAEPIGHRIRVNSDLNDDPVACEMIDLDKKSWVKIFKDTGIIEINSLNGKSWMVFDGNKEEIRMYGVKRIYARATDEIVLDTPDVYVTGNMHIAGYCSHSGCSCSCGG